MNTTIAQNYSKVKISLLFLPLFLIAIIVLFLFSNNALTANEYVQIQSKYFFLINSNYSQFPILIFNLTQIGDTIIALSLLSIFIIYASKIWEALLSATIFGAIFSGTFKNLYYVPRPAVAYDNNSFNIIGETLVGYSSLPSGHSITIFLVITILLFSFMPVKKVHQFLWILTLILVGILLVFTRVGVGAHHPLDTIFGSILGFVSGVLGILFCNKYKFLQWVSNIKSYPFFIILLLIFSIITVFKIKNENLLIYYFSLLTLIVTLYKLIKIYAKK